MSESEPPGKRFGCGQVLVIMLVTAALAAGGTWWWARHYLYAPELEPVELSSQEMSVLKGKLERLEDAGEGENLPGAPAEMPRGGGWEQDHDPRAEAYSEGDAERVITLTERELNALVAENDPETARHLAIDLGRNLLSLKVLVPLEPDVPLLGGKTVRIKAGLGVSHADGRTRVVLRGVSIGGIPLPSAWLGNLKGKDVLGEFREDGGFWKLFSDGIERLEIEDGRLRLELKE